jgi:replicative DNA helicase
MRIEDSILSNLLASEQYNRAVIPFLKPEYFSDKIEATILSEVVAFFNKHNTPITKEILSIELRGRDDLSDTELLTAEKLVSEFVVEVTNLEWLLDKTEEFVKRRSVYLAILESIKIIDGKEKTTLTEDAIPKLLSDALAVSLDSTVGHNYLADAEERYDAYTLKEDKIPFDLDQLNHVTKGGMSRKTLTTVAAMSGGGKSIFMTHTAASTLRQGKNVLYITLEMSEHRVAERIDANLMRVEVDTLKKMGKDEFVTKVSNIAAKTHGKLYIKEYPTGSAHTGHFRGLVEELKTKQNFVPDLIIVDYMGICASSRMKMGGAINTYSYIKSIAEELRSLAMELNVAILTGSQINRSGYDSTDIDMSNTADSMGVAMTVDIMLALMATDELSDMNQVIIKMLKNRYGELNKFVVGLDKSKMTFYDLEAGAQTITPVATFKPRSTSGPAPVTPIGRVRGITADAASQFKF